MPPPFPGFPAETLPFLRDLKANNKREWFQPRKPIYEEKVKAPLVELVLALGEELRDFGTDLVTAPDKAIYRIYRDVRFSKDKSPYKTHVAAVFSARGLEKHAGAGLYFHVSPDELLVGGGIYRPGSRELLAIRQRFERSARKGCSDISSARSPASVSSALPRASRRITRLRICWSTSSSWRPTIWTRPSPKHRSFSRNWSSASGPSSRSLFS